jgi:hypothetical protein
MGRALQASTLSLTVPQEYLSPHNAFPKVKSETQSPKILVVNNFLTVIHSILTIPPSLRTTPNEHIPTTRPHPLKKLYSRRLFLLHWTRRVLEVFVYWFLCDILSNAFLSLVGVHKAKFIFIYTPSRSSLKAQKYEYSR